MGRKSEKKDLIKRVSKYDLPCIDNPLPSGYRIVLARGEDPTYSPPIKVVTDVHVYADADLIVADGERFGKFLLEKCSGTFLKGIEAALIEQRRMYVTISSTDDSS